MVRGPDFGKHWSSGKGRRLIIKRSWVQTTELAGFKGCCLLHKNTENNKNKGSKIVHTKKNVLLYYNFGRHDCLNEKSGPLNNKTYLFLPANYKKHFNSKFVFWQKTCIYKIVYWSPGVKYQNLQGQILDCHMALILTATRYEFRVPHGMNSWLSPLDICVSS